MDGATGTQSIERAASLLRAVSGDAAGVTTARAASLTGLTRPTAHRILSALQRAGLLDLDNVRGVWLLGPELFLLGSLAAPRFDVAELARDEIRALAEATGESAFLSVRRGDENVCVLREEGSFPLRSFVLQEGTRFPLGVASGGLAILSFLEDAEIDAYFRRVTLERRWGPTHAEEQVRGRIAATRAAGYATNPALVLEGSWGMGAAVFDERGAPSGAVSITGVESRFRDERRPELGRLLLRAAHEVTRRIQGVVPRR
ncbi:IclR family transcriptional regulator [Microbacterium marinilacus]|uniref:IclR family transcriptional regulator n=1 Tax=Microbacterium marinilacus TaxID=415209 RepID=A0ABP7BQ78_9MICO